MVFCVGLPLSVVLHLSFKYLSRCFSIFVSIVFFLLHPLSHCPLCKVFFTDPLNMSCRFNYDVFFHFQGFLRGNIFSHSHHLLSVFFSDVSYSSDLAFLPPVYVYDIHHISVPHKHTTLFTCLMVFPSAATCWSIYCSQGITTFIISYSFGGQVLKRCLLVQMLPSLL